MMQDSDVCGGLQQAMVGRWGSGWVACGVSVGVVYAWLSAGELGRRYCKRDNQAQLTRRRRGGQTTLLPPEALRFRFDSIGAVVGGGSLGVGLGRMWGACGRGVCVAECR